MWTRSQIISQGLTHTKVTATFEWDPGDPSVNIQAGFGENTCAEIEAGPFVTWITWYDHSFAPEGQERIEVDGDDPASWFIDTIETTYHSKDGATLTLADRTMPGQDRGHVVRLAELPEVLAVVQAAFGDFKAAERLSAAQESVYLAASCLDELSHGIERLDPDELVVSEAKDELDKARAELQEARRDVEVRGVV